MLFREWKRLFEQVSTYGLEQLPALRAWAKSLGIATKDASQISDTVDHVKWEMLLISLVGRPILK
jgi:hypothetical protein